MSGVRMSIETLDPGRPTMHAAVCTHALRLAHGHQTSRIRTRCDRMSMRRSHSHPFAAAGLSTYWRRTSGISPCRPPGRTDASRR